VIQNKVEVKYKMEEEPINKEAPGDGREEVQEEEEELITAQTLDDLLEEIEKGEKEVERKKQERDEFQAWQKERAQKEEDARKEGEEVLSEVLSEVRSNVSQGSSDNFQPRNIEHLRRRQQQINARRDEERKREYLQEAEREYQRLEDEKEGQRQKEIFDREFGRQPPSPDIGRRTPANENTFNVTQQELDSHVARKVNEALERNKRTTGTVDLGEKTCVSIQDKINEGVSESRRPLSMRNMLTIVQTSVPVFKGEFGENVMTFLRQLDLHSKDSL